MHSNADHFLLDTIHYPKFKERTISKLWALWTYILVKMSPRELSHEREHPYTCTITSILYLTHYGHTPMRDDHN